MSPTARRYFGCVLPMLLCVFGCGTMLLLGYSAQVVFQLVRVPDDSMAPSLTPGRQVLVNNTDFWNADPSRGQVVSVRRPGGWVMRRVIALPGETVAVQDGRALVDEQACDGVPPSEANGPDQAPLLLGPGEYFVLADNRAAPDSRIWGPIPRTDLVGVVAFQIDRDRNFEPVPVATACPGPTVTPRPTSDRSRRSPSRSWFAPEPVRATPTPLATLPAALPSATLPATPPAPLPATQPTLPTTLPSTTVPGTLPAATVPGTLPAATLPATLPATPPATPGP